MKFAGFSSREGGNCLENFREMKVRLERRNFVGLVSAHAKKSFGKRKGGFVRLSRDSAK